MFNTSEWEALQNNSEGKKEVLGHGVGDAGEGRGDSVFHDDFL